MPNTGLCRLSVFASAWRTSAYRQPKLREIYVNATEGAASIEVKCFLAWFLSNVSGHRRVQSCRRGGILSGKRGTWHFVDLWRTLK